MQKNKRLQDALRELISIVEIHTNATGNNFAWAELEEARMALDEQEVDMEHKHTPGPWVKTSESLPKEYEEVYAKNEDGSIRIARLSKSEGGCWQLATFLVDTKRPGYAWPIDKVVEWRPIQPATALSVAAPKLLEALRELVACKRMKEQIAIQQGLVIETDEDMEEMDRIMSDYARRQPKAWENAALILAKATGATHE